MNDDGNPCDVAVVAAFRLEVELLASRLEDKSPVCEHGLLKYVTGLYRQQRVAVATTGVGKVRAAAGTQAAIHLFQPRRIIMCGTAGSLADKVHALDLVVACELLQHDTGPGEPEPVPADPELYQRLEAAARKAVQGTGHTVHGAMLVSGDKPIIDNDMRAYLSGRFKAAAVDMEAAAVAAVCAYNHLPMAAVKAVTDSADSHVEADFKKYVKQGAALAQEAVLQLLDDLDFLGDPAVSDNQAPGDD